MGNSLAKIKNKFNLDNILYWYIIIQPIVDIITSICVRNISEKLSIGIAIRMAFMIFIVIYTLIKTKGKERTLAFIYYALIAVYSVCYMFFRYKANGVVAIFTEVKGLIKTMYFPVVLASFLAIFKTDKYKTKRNALNISLLIYSIVIVVSSILNIAYKTYGDEIYKGTVGLFYAGNEIGAILSILLPITFISFLTKKFKIFNVICGAVGIVAILEIGTKTPFAAAIGLLGILLVIMLIKMFTKERKRTYKYFSTLLCFIIIFGIFINQVPAVENLRVKFDDSNTQGTQTNPDSEKNKDTENDNEKELNPILAKILSNRNLFFKDTLKEYKQSGITTKILGVGYAHKNAEGIIEERKLVEIDYFDIFFCQGILGTVIYWTPLILVIIVIVQNIFRSFLKNIRNGKVILALYSVLLSFGIALFAGHVFTAPAVSIFVIVNMFELIYLLKNKEEIYEE